MPFSAQKTTTDCASSPTWRQNARRRLLQWYRQNARDLPWRRTVDPYAIWVSEIMLQQTQVATVEGYFSRFLTSFPSVAALAAAEETTVLRLWEGLGYYRRARQMHAAAKIVVAQHSGKFPSNMHALWQLPGIGRYTAGAILSIAFDQSAPILEANTVRLLCRLLAFRGDPHSTIGQQLLWQAAENFLTKRGSGELNQALMELGSLICTPREPKCDECPLRALCPTWHGRWQAEIPAPRRQPVVENVQEAAVVIVRRGKILLRKCGSAERWAGLWDFPRFLLPRPANRQKTIKPRLPVAPHRRAEIIDHVWQMTNVKITQPKYIVTLRHSVTRFRITLECFIAQCDRAGKLRSSRKSTAGQGELQWIEPAALNDYPLSVTGRKLARLIQEHGIGKNRRTKRVVACD
ncbi:MAG TPA: A/G-specific adenine glycosylase [Pirellulales bacterium]|jgi:A/G-specific adenine glycosylase|nr:A/G-specific adenine glycosylase [Pirellulales bacterium]